MNDCAPNKFYVRVYPGSGVFDYTPPPFDSAEDALAYANEKAALIVANMRAGQHFKITITASKEA